MPKRRMASFGGKFLDEFDLPGSESQEAVDLLEEHGFSTRTGFSVQIVFESGNVDDPVVAVFQWGWGTGLIGLGKEGPIDAWVPMMLFAVIFGLSMDYEVFLLSRIREDYDRSHATPLPWPTAWPPPPG